MYSSKVDLEERSVSGDESLNTPPPPPGTYGIARPVFWGAGRIHDRMANSVRLDVVTDGGLDADGIPIISQSNAEQVGNALPGHLRKEYFAKLRESPYARAEAEELAQRASLTMLRESLPGIIAEAVKLASKK